MNTKNIRLGFMNLMLFGSYLKVFIGLIGLFLMDVGHELTILGTTALNNQYSQPTINNYLNRFEPQHKNKVRTKTQPK